MAKKKRGKEECEAELAFVKANGVATNITKIIRDAFKWGSLAWIFYVVYLSIEKLAGKRTLADITVNGGVSLNIPDTGLGLLFDPKTMAVLGLLFGFGGILYGRNQARLRRSTIERLHPDQQAREKAIDSARTSSRLTSTGDTRPEDA